jgi:hypothetical protein
MINKEIPEWERKFRDQFANTGFNAGVRQAIIDFIRTQLQKAEKRGAERAVDFIKKHELTKAWGPELGDKGYSIDSYSRVFEEARNLPLI